MSARILSAVVSTRKDWGRDLPGYHGAEVAGYGDHAHAQAQARGIQSALVRRPWGRDLHPGQDADNDSIKKVRDDTEAAHDANQQGKGSNEFHQAYHHLYSANHSGTPRKAADHLEKAADALFMARRAGANVGALPERAKALAAKHRPAAGTPGWF